MTPGSNRGAPGTARPKGSGFNRACEPCSHAERHLDRHVRTQAEDAGVAAAPVLVIVGDVDAEHAEAQVRPDGVPEVRVARSGRPAVTEPGGNVRLDAQAGRGQAHREAHRADHARGGRPAGAARITARGADLKVDRYGNQTATDDAHRRVAADGRGARGGVLGLVALDAGRQGQRAETERRAAAEGVALAEGRIRPAPVSVDGDASDALRAVPHRHAGPLRRGGRGHARDHCHRKKHALHMRPQSKMFDCSSVMQTHVPRRPISRLAPMPITWWAVPLANFSESYAIWTAMGPKPMLPPTTQPKFVSSLRAPTGTFQYLWQRTPGEKYGST